MLETLESVIVAQARQVIALVSVLTLYGIFTIAVAILTGQLTMSASSRRV